jgi:hypothetical protein
LINVRRIVTVTLKCFKLALTGMHAASTTQISGAYTMIKLDTALDTAQLDVPPKSPHSAADNYLSFDSYTGMESTPARETMHCKVININLN